MRFWVSRSYFSERSCPAGRLHPCVAGRKHRRARKAPAAQTEQHRGPETSEAVLHAAAEGDRRGIGSVTRRTRHLTDVTSVPNGFGDHLIVEHEVVGIRRDG